MNADSANIVLAILFQKLYPNYNEISLTAEQM